MRLWPSGALKFLPLTFLILLVSVVKAPAQSSAGRLHGQVTDPSGAVIPNAEITLKNSSGLTSAAKSDGAGAYDVKLAPGKYTVTVRAKGFTTSTSQMEVVAGQDRKLDFPLDIQTKEEEVVVEGEGAKVSTNPDNNASSLVITGKDLDALSDDPDELQSELQALAGPSAGPNGGQIYIDGFTGGQLPPKSSIREIRINQNPFSAQFDRMGFGRIEILTKPGTDTPHGQFFFNDNHSVFDALNPFAASEPPFNSEMFNGNVGGPINKKASYFVSAERRDIHDAAVISADAFTAAGQKVVGVLNPRIRMAASTRIDYQLAASNTLTVRYQYVHNSEKNDGLGQLTLPSQAYNQTSYEHTVQVSDTQVLSPRAVNETRFEWERGGTDQNSLNTAPTINVLGDFNGGGNPLGISNQISDHYEVQNYTSMNLNRHFIRFGGRLRVTALTSQSLQGFNGTYTFAATKDPITHADILALTNYQNHMPTQFTLTHGNQTTFSDTFADAGLYVEDDWKLHTNMTLSYGLRFETQNGIHDHGDWAPRLSFAWGVDGKKNAAPKTVIKTGFGIFYDRFAQNLIMQALRLNGVNQQQYTITAGPNGENQALLQTLYTTFPATPPPISSLTAAGTGTYSIAPSLRAPYTIQAAASVERQVTKASTLSVTYVHSQGVHQLFSLNCQAMAAGTCASLNAPLLTIAAPQYVYMSEGVFRQNQLISTFNVRVGTRLSIFSYYSLSYANGDTSGAGTLPSDPALGITADYGRTAFDVRNRAFFGGTISLAHGFRVSPFMVANSGPPFNITLGQDLNGDSIFNDRPSLAASGVTTNSVVTPWGSFDTAPGANEPRIPVNFGTTPAQFTLNVRLSKTFGIGPKLQQTAANGQGGNQGSKPGDGAGRGAPNNGGGRGPGGGGPMAGGPRGGGPMGGIFNPERSSQRYSLTFSANARNLFNNVNEGQLIGNLSAGPTRFGTPTSLAGGVFNTQSANRRVDFQVMFSF